MTCGGSGHRHRKRSCIPGTANAGSQDVSCPGNSFESDETCGSGLPCPDPHCPDGYQYSKEYVLIISKVDQLTLFQSGEGRLSPPITTGTPNFFHLPASLN